MVYREEGRGGEREEGREGGEREFSLTQNWLLQIKIFMVKFNMGGGLEGEEEERKKEGSENMKGTVEEEKKRKRGRERGGGGRDGDADTERERES